MTTFYTYNATGRVERIERRRQRRAERRGRQGEKGPEKSAAEPEKPREVEVGSKVRMAGQAMVGVVQSVKGKRAQVAFGQILTTVDKASLTVVSNNEYREATRPTTARTVVSVDISSRKLNFKDHIDVRGMRAAEALEAVQDLVDDALMVGVGSVTILHGKGTGALKEEIRRYLRKECLPSLQNAVRLADFFRCPLDYLFGRAEDFTEQSYPAPPPFGGHFTAFLEKYGCTRYRLSQEIGGLTQCRLNAWAHGKSAPSVGNLIRIADYCRCSLDELVGRDN